MPTSLPASAMSRLLPAACLLRSNRLIHHRLIPPPCGEGRPEGWGSGGPKCRTRHTPIRRFAPLSPQGGRMRIQDVASLHPPENHKGISECDDEWPPERCTKNTEPGQEDEGATEQRDEQAIAARRIEPQYAMAGIAAG